MPGDLRDAVKSALNAICHAHPRHEFSYYDMNISVEWFETNISVTINSSRDLAMSRPFECSDTLGVFKFVKRAYECLNDVRRREVYDALFGSYEFSGNPNYFCDETLDDLTQITSEFHNNLYRVFSDKERLIVMWEFLVRHVFLVVYRDDFVTLTERVSGCEDVTIEVDRPREQITKVLRRILYNAKIQ